MPHVRLKPQIKAILLPKELLLYEAVQSRMAYFVPCVIMVAGLLLCLPITWELLSELPQLAELYPHAYHLMFELRFALVLIAGGLGMLYQRNKAARKNQHFITNLRVVEHSKTLLHDDVQYIMLHHIKLVKVKATLMQTLTFTGKMILEDDMGYEHIEIPDVASPRDFKKAILKAKSRFEDVAARAEKEGVLKQRQSAKSKREQRQLQRKAAQEQQRMDNSGGY
jgi:hypothetical protein